MKSYVYFFDKNRDKKVRYSNYKSFEEYLHGSFFWLVSTEKFDLTSCCFRCEIDIPFSLLSLEGEERYVEVDSSNVFLKFLVEDSVSKDDFFYLINKKFSNTCTPYYQGFMIHHGDLSEFVNTSLDDTRFCSDSERLLCIMYILSLTFGGYGCRVADVPLIDTLNWIHPKNFFRWFFRYFYVDTKIGSDTFCVAFEDMLVLLKTGCFEFLEFISFLDKGGENDNRSIFERFVSSHLNRVE